MAYVLGDASLGQGARDHRVVGVISERIGDGLRNDDRTGEMDDGINVVLRDQTLDKLRIAGFARYETRLLTDEAAHAGREIVEHDDAFAAVEQRVRHVTADIAGAS